MNSYKLTDKYCLINNDIKILKQHINKIDKYHTFSVNRSFYYFYNGNLVPSLPDQKQTTYQGITILGYGNEFIHLFDTFEGKIDEYKFDKEYNDIIKWYKG
jgi:hypothetical protein